MRVLLSNDDGIHAPGIRALVSALVDLGEILVVAPDRERSATGHAITVHHPLRVESVYLPENPQAKAWSLNGTPSDCIKLALEALLPERPDLIISGINLGPNLGTDVLYSGTVSAAVEGMIYGVPSIALSLCASGDAEVNFQAAAEWAKSLAYQVQEKGLPPDTILNVNIPSLQWGEIAGIRVTRLGRRRYTNVFDKRVDPRGRTYYWMAGEAVNLDAGPETDISAILDNLISVTPVYFGLNQDEYIRQIGQWDFKLGTR